MYRYRVVTTAGVCLLLLSLSPILSAQSGGTQSDQAGTPPPGTVSNHHQILITGCLKRGNESGGGYYITDQNGKTWELLPNGIDLAAHVNHSVSIAGKEATASKQQEAKKESSEKTEAGGNPPADLRVMSLKMLSPSCTR